MSELQLRNCLLDCRVLEHLHVNGGLDVVRNSYFPAQNSAALTWGQNPLLGWKVQGRTIFDRRGVRRLDSGGLG